MTTLELALLLSYALSAEPTSGKVDILDTKSGEDAALSVSSLMDSAAIDGEVKDGEELLEVIERAGVG